MNLCRLFSFPVVIVFFALLLGIGNEVHARDFTGADCVDGALNLTQLDLGTSTFNTFDSSCYIRITNATATQLTFASTGPLDNLQLSITALTFTAPATAGTPLIEFGAAITGNRTRIAIDGVTASLPSAVTTASGAEYFIVRFDSPVTARTLMFSSIIVTGNPSSAGSLFSYICYFASTVTGGKSFYSMLQFVSNSLVGVHSGTTADSSIRSYLLFITDVVSDFGEFEILANTLSVVANPGSSGSAQFYVLHAQGDVTFSVPEVYSGIDFARNNMSGCSAATGIGASVYGAKFDGAVTTTSFNVWLHDMRNVDLAVVGDSVSADAGISVYGFYFGGVVTTRTTQGPNILLVNIGGQIRARSSPATVAAVVYERPLSAPVGSVSLTRSSIDFSTGAGFTTTGADVDVYMMKVNSAAVGVRMYAAGNHISGRYASAWAGANVRLFMLYAASSSGASLFLEGNVFSAHAISSGGFIQLMNAFFVGTTTGNNNNNNTWLDLSRVIVTGVYRSNHSYVCVASVACGIGAALSGFGTVHSTGQALNYEAKSSDTGYSFGATLGLVCAAATTSTTTTTTLTSSTTTTTTTTTEEPSAAATTRLPPALTITATTANAPPNNNSHNMSSNSGSSTSNSGGGSSGVSAGGAVGIAIGVAVVLVVVVVAVVICILRSQRRAAAAGGLDDMTPSILDASATPAAGTEYSEME